MTHEEIREQNMQRVILAAAKLFYDYGVADTKITEIAQKAGLTPTSVYRYFNDKETIVIRVSELMALRYSQACAKHFKKIDFDALTGYEQSEMILRYFFETVQNHQHFMKLVSELYIFFQSSRNQKQLLHKKFDVFHNLSISIRAIGRGVQDGSIRNDIDPQNLFEISAFAAIGTMLMVCERYTGTNDDIDLPPYLIDGCLDLIMTYLRPQASK